MLACAFGAYSIQAATPLCEDDIILEPLLGHGFVLDDFLMAYAKDEQLVYPWVKSVISPILISLLICITAKPVVFLFRKTVLSR